MYDDWKRFIVKWCCCTLELPNPSVAYTYSFLNCRRDKGVVDDRNQPWQAVREYGYLSFIHNNLRYIIKYQLYTVVYCQFWPSRTVPWLKSTLCSYGTTLYVLLDK